jgi:hypothetical protein
MNILILLFAIFSLIVAQNCATTGCAVAECCSQVLNASIITFSMDGAEPLTRTASPLMDVLVVVPHRTLLLLLQLVLHKPLAEMV